MNHYQRQGMVFADKPRLASIINNNTSSDNLLIISCTSKILSNFYKRSFDIVVSSLVIVFLLSWLLPILGLLIKLNSKGPVFFIQNRMGILGKLFPCIKLRTMFVNAEAHYEQANENDSRITGVGKFLRLTCMDELPQFFNVLIGHMSIVGPRPHMLTDCKQFSNYIKHYNSRCVVKPGITGIAQVKGYRGNTKDFFDISHRYKMDMFYIRNFSFSLDMLILRKTFHAIVKIFYTLLSSARNKKSSYNFRFDKVMR